MKKLLEALLEILKKPQINGIATHVWVDTILDVIGLILTLYLITMIFLIFEWQHFKMVWVHFTSTMQLLKLHVLLIINGSDIVVIRQMCQKVLIMFVY